MLQIDEKVDFLKTLIERGFDYKYIQNRFLEKYCEFLSIKHIYGVFRLISLEHYLQGVETKTKENPLFPKLRFTLRYMPPSKIIDEIVEGESSKWRIYSATDHYEKKYYILVKHREEFVGTIPLDNPPVSFLLKGDVLVIAFRRSILSFYLPSLKEIFSSARLSPEIKAITERAIEYDKDILQEFKLEEDGNIQFLGLIEREEVYLTDSIKPKEDEAEIIENQNDLSTKNSKEDNLQYVDNSLQSSDISLPVFLIAYVTTGDETLINVNCYLKDRYPKIGFETDSIVKPFPYHSARLRGEIKYQVSSKNYIGEILSQTLQDSYSSLEMFEKFFNYHILTKLRLLIFANEVNSVYILNCIPDNIADTTPIVSFKIEDGKLLEVEKKEIQWNPIGLPSIKRDKFIHFPNTENLGSRRNLFLSTSSEFFCFSVIG